MSGRQGKNIRTVKPITAKQRTASRAYNKRQSPITPAAGGLPTGSWWLEARSREAFAAKVSDEAKRMAESKFGRVMNPIQES